MKKEMICAYCRKEIIDGVYNVNNDDSSFICQMCQDTITCENVLTNVFSWYKRPESFSCLIKVDKLHIYGVSVKRESIKEWKMKYPGRR